MKEQCPNLRNAYRKSCVAKCLRFYKLAALTGLERSQHTRVDFRFSRMAGSSLRTGSRLVLERASRVDSRVSGTSRERSADEDSRSDSPALRSRNHAFDRRIFFPPSLGACSQARRAETMLIYRQNKPSLHTIRYETGLSKRK